VSLSYEEANEIVLRGQAPELNAVLTFAGQLEKSVAFKKFNIKVRFATKKKIEGIELLDFEIVCTKK
jgi:hypothetical protein